MTFEPDGFVWFAGWSDDTNLQPIIRGFLSWIDETVSNIDASDRDANLSAQIRYAGWA
ncbi:MAG: hypothetical protein KDI55_00060 [Anaerolineae bacterium]|nr:hypothetical protein [Anaerolineae bacterium]